MPSPQESEHQALDIVDDSRGLTVEDLRTVKRIVRAYKALGWIFAALLGLSMFVVSLLDLFERVSGVSPR